jgi:alkylation response protein AidB-like acyl-CoA dehydrogenase
MTMSATQFTVDTRDMRFVLHEVLDTVTALKDYEAFEEVDQDLINTMLDEAERVATELVAPTNGPGDREGCHLDADGTVKTPAGYKEAFATFAEGGWQALGAPVEYGGMGMPHALDAAVGEMMTGANPAFSMYPGLTRGAANLLAKFASEDYRALICEKMFTGEWGGTMCLTEPGAGSDVGSNRTKAVPADEDGVFLLEGEKIFISSGDNDLFDNIIHLVLARLPGAPEGTRGLSIFMVPKYEFDFETGEIGARNGVYVEKIEEKMGIHGNATCALSFGARAPAKGWLLGEAGQGMPIMFHMMNEARLEVGVQGLSGGSAAYNYAKSYAKDRIQGVSIDEHGKDGAKAVSIIEHPDVRRMLLWQKVHVETMRSFIFDVALRLDMMHHETDKTKAREYKGYVELMTPIVKSYCSDRGFDVSVMALQTFGGYGFIGEYPVEQVVRDTKIASIYEGTNGIQAMDLVGRKMTKGQGILFMNWMGEVGGVVNKAKEFEGLAESAAAVDKAKDVLGASAMHLGGLGMQGDRKGAMLYALPFLNQFGNVALGVEALKQATVASQKLAAGGLSEADTRFYKGKLQNLSFYVSNVLPESIALGKTIRSGDKSALDEELFI